MANKSNSPITSFQAVSRGKINTISACMGKPLISVSTKEKVVQIWDRRKLPLGSRKEVEKRASEPFAEIRMAPLVGLTHGKGTNDRKRKSISRRSALIIHSLTGLLQVHNLHSSIQTDREKYSQFHTTILYGYGTVPKRFKGEAKRCCVSVTIT